MTNNMILKLTLATGLAAVATFARADDPLAKLADCMKLPAASAQQNACIAEAKKMQAATPKAAAMPRLAAQPMAATQPMATAQPMAAATAAKPAAAAKTAAPAAAPAAPQAPPVPADVKQAAQLVGLAGGSRNAALPAGATKTDISGLDLEAAMMAVQSQRANLLEAQLKQEIDGLQARNKKVATLNEILGALNASAASAPTKPDAIVTLAKDGAGKDLLAKMQSVQVDTKWITTASDKGSTLYQSSRAKLDTSIQGLKGSIDSLNSSQQMDMLRLQSLTNKRNEAFDLMTNFIKKMADSRAQILGNMR